jgi:alpha-L-rhamnosidase
LQTAGGAEVREQGFVWRRGIAGAVAVLVAIAGAALVVAMAATAAEAASGRDGAGHDRAARADRAAGADRAADADRAAGADRGGDHGSAALRVTNLETEHARDPLGIDVQHPRLSWQLRSRKPDVQQSAYRILVASSRAALDGDRGDVWDSGRVRSGDSIEVPYDGPALQSRRRYHWKVQVYDDHNRASRWSEPAHWEMGLLEPADWSARWIGMPQPAQEQLGFEGSRWIWHDEPGGPFFPAGVRYYRKAVDLPAGRRVTRARVVATGDDELELFLNGTRIATSVWWYEPQSVDVTSMLRDGRNAVGLAITNRGREAGAIALLRVDFADGEPLIVATDGSWRSSATAQTGWSEPGFDDSAWTAPRVLANYGDPPWGALSFPRDPTPAPLLRREFDVHGQVRRARAYVSGLAYYELHVNGRKVGDHVLDPVFTDYDDRVNYVTYDVTKALHEGRNALGAELGRGFYGLEVGTVWDWHKPPWRDEPKLLMQLEIEYADGSVERIASDDGWRTARGPRLSDSIYVGETYDARLEPRGWKSPGFDAAAWQPATPMTPPRGRLVAQALEPIRVVDTLTPTQVTEPKPGVYVFDLGRTISGWARLSVDGPAGTRVTLREGEKLNADGTVSTSQGQVSSSRFQTDEYILRGGGREVWEPSFSYKGLRYVEVEGLPGPPDDATIRGREVHSAVANAGGFASSDPLYDRIHDAMRRTSLNNLHGIPADTMYEKSGWTGDVQVSAPSWLENFDMVRFFEKWLDDFRDSQYPNGQIPTVVPTSGWSGYVTGLYGLAPEWTAAYPIVAWELYLRAGDRRALEEHYEPLARYVAWEQTRLTDGIAPTSLGDWMAPDANGVPPVDTRVTATAYVFRELDLMARIARALGRTADARRYEADAAHVRERFNAAFFDAGRAEYRSAAEYRQTDNALALAFGLAPAGQRQAIVDGLARDVEARGRHLNTGILGTAVLLEVLTDGGHGELAHAIANQRSFPSWGYLFDNGMDTLLESWRLDSRSRNHHYLGTIDRWLFEDVAGLEPDPERPGYRHVLIHPRPGGGLTHAQAWHDSPYGRVSSAWRVQDDRFTLDVTIPANASATVRLPGRETRTVEVGSGRHRFHTKLGGSR